MMIHKDKRFTGATTDGVIWTPSDGCSIVITDIIFTTSEAATVTLFYDDNAEDNRIVDGDFAANSGIAHSFRPVTLPRNKPLLVTTSAGNLKIVVVGYEA